MTSVSTLLIVLASLFSTQGEKATIEGKVTVASNGEVLLFATVILYQNNQLILAKETDLDGNYFMSDIRPGTYDLEASYVGFVSQRQTGIVIKAGKTNQLNFQLSDDNTLLEVQIMEYKVPLISTDIQLLGSSVTGEKSRSLPTKSIEGIKSKLTGISKMDEVTMRSSRSNEGVFFLDGIRYDLSNVAHQESYSKMEESKFIHTEEQALSTFALDVDRASYSNVRRFINQGQLPPKDAVRIEEMINYFDYQYLKPKGDDIIQVSTRYTDCPWNMDLKLLHIGIQSKKVETQNLPPSNLVFLIDVSGSMSSSNKLPLVVSSLKLLLDQLRPQDRVAIVTYAGAAGVALESTPASQKQKITDALEALASGGSTAGAEGIITAYKIAAENFIKNGNNRVILATDGDFNVGINDDDGLERLIESKKQTGVFLSVLGFGMGNYKDDKMQILADKGNGNHAYIDQLKEAHKVFVSEFSGTIHTLAKDLKFQIEFNPQNVKYYRLIGYENRIMPSDHFNDDRKDGGELGMGHQMTAIYEIIPNDESMEIGVDPLKYREQSPEKRILDKFQDELATIKCRYKDPSSDKSKKWDQVIPAKYVNIQDISQDEQFSVAVAFAGMKMRQMSTIDPKNTWADVVTLAETAISNDKEEYRAEFVRLIKSCASLNKELTLNINED